MRTIGAIVGLAAFNALLALPDAVTSGAAWRLAVVLPEAALVAWMVVAVGRRPRTRCYWPAVGIVVGVFAGYALAETFFRYIYARPFVPRVDIPMVRGGLLLLFGTIGRLADVLTPVVIVLFALFLVAAGTAIALMLRIPLVPRSVGRPLLAVPIGATILSIAIPAFGVESARLTPRLVAAIRDDGSAEFRDVLTAAEPFAQQATLADAANPTEEAPTAVDYRFPGLRDRDIYLFAIEAYGYAAHSRPALFEQLRPAFERFATVLDENGYEVLTAYLRSPVAGGFSWLAEATFLTGQWVDSQRAFEQLYGANLATLTGMLQGAGYYTLTMRPGTVHGSWPEGWDLYRFEESYVAHDGDFDYVGPWFSFVPITDQFTLWTAHRRIAEIRSAGGPAADRPLLVHYQLVSSHTPFNRIPPVIEPWDALGNGQVYNDRAAEIRTFANTWTGGEELEEGYVAALSYVFTVLSDYLERYLDHSRNPILIAFGDHQAQRPIREQNAALSVPVHVATRDRDIARRFEARGFERGIRSTAAPPHPRMSEFFPMFAAIAREAGGAPEQPDG